MGSLGARRLTATSDLDMIVIYDPADVEASDGKRPLAARLYYARLTQAMITAMTAPMSQGRLYEVDMRLRPSGNQGPVATSLASFESYQMTQAWVWEHLALTRADVIVGPKDLADDFVALRSNVLAKPRDRSATLGRGRADAGASGGSKGGRWHLGRKERAGTVAGYRITGPSGGVAAGRNRVPDHRCLMRRLRPRSSVLRMHNGSRMPMTPAGRCNRRRGFYRQRFWAAASWGRRARGF